MCHNLKVYVVCVFGLSSLLADKPEPGLFVHGHIPGCGGQSVDSGVQLAWIQIPALPLTVCETSGRSLVPSEAQFLYPWNRGDDGTCLGGGFEHLFSWNEHQALSVASAS